MTGAGSDIAGATYRPLFSTIHDAATVKSLPVIPSSHVTPNTGTGAVHCAPAHGDEDYNVFRSLGLLSSSNSTSGGLLCHVDVTGKFTEEIADVVGHDAAKDLVGQDVLKSGGKAMVALLAKTGALRKIERIRHSYPYDWRTDEPIIVMYAFYVYVCFPPCSDTAFASATSQWFANTDRIKDDALAAIQNITSHPAGCALLLAPSRFSALLTRAM